MWRFALPFPFCIYIWLPYKSCHLSTVLFSNYLLISFYIFAVFESAFSASISLLGLQFYLLLQGRATAYSQPVTKGNVIETFTVIETAKGRSELMRFDPTPRLCMLGLNSNNEALISSSNTVLPGPSGPHFALCIWLCMLSVWPFHAFLLWWFLDANSIC